jgi:hypothetical protein
MLGLDPEVTDEPCATGQRVERLLAPEETPQARNEVHGDGHRWEKTWSWAFTTK